MAEQLLHLRGFQMNLVDKAIGYFSPKKGMERAKQRKLLNKYEALEPSRYRTNKRSKATSIELSSQSFDKLRSMARHLEENTPIATSIIDAFCNNVIGEKGIQIEPMPLNHDGSVNEDLQKDIKRLWSLYCRHTDTRGNAMPQVQRLLVNHWIVDGEVFAQHITHNHLFKKKNKLPYIQQLIEADYLPNWGNGVDIIAGVKFDSWLNPSQFYFSKDPNGILTGQNTVAIDADNVLHLALKRKINQVRGITRFASVINSVTDLHDYENSERIAAKIAASMVGYIKKEMPTEEFTLDDYKDADEELKRDASNMIEISPGMIAHNLGIGEEIGVIQSNRSASYMTEFGNHMVRNIAAGAGASFSTASRNYNGTYSAQRQELLEQWQYYKVLQNEFGCQYLQPTYIKFVQSLIESGMINVPKDVWLVDNAQYLAPVMPWIDPYKEIMAHKVAIEIGTKSRAETITERGGTPSETFENIVKENGIGIFNQTGAINEKEKTEETIRDEDEKSD